MESKNCEYEIVNNNGITCFYKKGTTILHKDGGPAIIHSDGYKEWRKNGEIHRVSGPAIEWPDGHKSWWIQGIHLADEEAHTKMVNKYYFKD